MAMNLLPRCASVHHQSGACRSPFLTPSEGLATLNPPAWHQCHAKSGIGNGFLGRPVNIIAPMICISRALRLKVRAQRTEYSATFEDLKIQCTGDVVRSYLHTTALSAELLRGPGGRSKFVSQEACKALVEAESVCKGFLPQVLRGSALVSKILDLLVESFRDAASGSNSFRALETPLLTFHNKAPLNMRKALQGRIVSAAGKLLSSPPETYPLGISLTALAAAVRGPGGCAQEGFPNVWVGYFKLCLYLCHVGVWKLNMLVAKPIICGPLTHHLRQRCKNVAVCDIQWSRTQKVQSRHRRLTAVQ
ncbi:unnamed protein product [Durusdinium trenchii]